jgi:hypothetical protein
MIRFNFAIVNPTKWIKPFSTTFGFVKSGQLTRHKFFELQIAHWNIDYIFELDVNLIWWGHDHAGFKFNMAIIGYELAMQIYDHRHWDYTNNHWDPPDRWEII